ncbi:MAG: TlpA disulfide reductase family protein [Terriglobia bacterium]
MEEQIPSENTPQASEAPQGSPVEKPASPKSKLAAGALLALVLVVGLYYLNRYWIAPAVRAQTKSEGIHPLAPAFSLTDISGKPLNLSDYQGKVVLLDFWATWCGPCRIEIPGFIELQKRYADQGFTMIGISMDDSAEPVVGFYKELQMNYPVAVGNDRLGELYGGMPGLPTTFLIGRDGRIYAKHVGAYSLGVFEAEIKELLAASPSDEDKSFQQVGQVFGDDKIELGNPAAIDSEVPGIDLSKLTADQKEAFKKILASQQCTCGCKLSLLRCRQVDRSCSISRKLAQDQLDAFLKTKSPGSTTN